VLIAFELIAFADDFLIPRELVGMFAGIDLIFDSDDEAGVVARNEQVNVTPLAANFDAAQFAAV